MHKKFLGLGRSLPSTGIDFNKFTSTKDMSASLEALLSSPGLKGPDRLALEPRILLDAAGVDTAETAINEVAQADAEAWAESIAHNDNQTDLQETQQQTTQEILFIDEAGICDSAISGVVTMLLAGSLEQEPMLPELRQELNIYKAGSFPDGAPSWIVHDGLRNRYFRIGERSFQLLSIWKVEAVSEFADRASVQLQLPVSTREVEALVKFLFANNLTLTGPQNDHVSYFRQHKAARKGWFGSVVHNYLFFKIPLLRPQPLIDAAWPVVSPFFTRGFALVLLLVAMFALFLVSRQWATFMATFVSFLTFDGLALYLISLVFLKVCHEFGHAFMAKKFDVKVPTIGVAFLVLFPVLYTDTSGAVDLRERRSKLLIDCGGMIVELALAAIATLLWVFLPDGPLRAIAFTTATLSWVLSVVINLNPLMRFDGYYVLSDLLGVENLQGRSFEMAKWKLREVLFKPGKKQPEIVSNRMRVVMIYYAWATWIYRFFLFLGIALLVYHFFIKVVGIMLFAVEIIWFIVLPIWRELKVWWQERESFTTPRFAMTALGVFALSGLSALPLSTQIQVATVSKAASQVKIYPPEPGKIVQLELPADKPVAKGQVLAVLEAPDLESQIRLSELRLDLLQTRLRRATTNAVDLSSISVVRQELESERARLESLRLKQGQLVIRAPFDGYLENIDPELHLDQWVGVSHPLALIRSAAGTQLLGLVTADDVMRVQDGARGVFIPDGTLLARKAVRLTSVSSVAADRLEYDMLADAEGGMVPTVQKADGTFEPQGAWFRVEMQLETHDGQDIVPTAMNRGVAVLNGEPQSLLVAGLRQIASVLIRESGF